MKFDNIRQLYKELTTERQVRSMLERENGNTLNTGRLTRTLTKNTQKIQTENEDETYKEINTQGVR